ncbi:helix-turn-helix domain-containing protein [Streptomyces huasconensis]|uniref:helix-turn-helix domain-containing protein n=1 Tax=Streptomyces huasconensis TaxID=1854574 RepID=UPI0036FA2131
MPQSPATSLPSPKERRRLREAKSLSQAALAARLGVSRETVRSWERGRTNPRGRTHEAYARFLTTAAEEQTGRTAPSPAPAPGPKTTPASASPAPPASPARRNPRTQPTEGARSTTRPEPPAKRAAKPQTPTAVTAAPAPVTGHPHRRPAPARRADLTPAQAFDALCQETAPTLVRQTYLLTGRRTLAQEAVERAFQQAWQRWPEVAVDRDPAGWVRAAAHEYAVSPWHRFRPGLHFPDAPPAEPADRVLFGVLLSLSPAQRRALLLYDGIGLDLPDTAAETEASTPATANRLLYARELIAERLPDLADPETLHRRLGELGAAEKLGVPNPERVRVTGERRARLWTRAAIALTTLIVGATALTLRTAPTRYEPPQAPGKAISGVPARMGPGPLTHEDAELREKLRAELTTGPHRLTPQSK